VGQVQERVQSLELELELVEELEPFLEQEQEQAAV
jgi:hypothetical protein